MSEEYDFAAELEWLTSPAAYGLRDKDRRVRLITAGQAAQRRILALEESLAHAREKAIEDAASAAEAWEPVIKLLPLCDEDANEAAMTGQWEARERIVDAIRSLKAETP